VVLSIHSNTEAIIMINYLNQLEERIRINHPVAYYLGGTIIMAVSIAVFMFVVYVVGA